MTLLQFEEIIDRIEGMRQQLSVLGDQLRAELDAVTRLVEVVGLKESRILEAVLPPKDLE